MIADFIIFLVFYFLVLPILPFFFERESIMKVIISLIFVTFLSFLVLFLTTTA